MYVLSGPGCAGFAAAAVGGGVRLLTSGLKQVQGISLTLYVYQLRKGENGTENVAVEKVTYTKPVEPTGAS